MHTTQFIKQKEGTVGFITEVTSLKADPMFYGRRAARQAESLETCLKGILEEADSIQPNRRKLNRLLATAVGIKQALIEEVQEMPFAAVRLREIVDTLVELEIILANPYDRSLKGLKRLRTAEEIRAFGRSHFERAIYPAQRQLTFLKGTYVISGKAA